MTEAVAKLPDVGATGVTSLEALKYASQADMFQDDPNFYSWLEDWIGEKALEFLISGGSCDGYR